MVRTPIGAQRLRGGETSRRRAQRLSHQSRMLLDFSKNRGSDFQRREALLAGDAWGAALGDGGDELLHFELERLGFIENQRGEIDFHSVADAKTDGVLTGIIERDVFVRLKQPKLAHAFGRYSTGGEIGDAAARKLKADVGDIDFGGKNGDAGGSDFFGRRVRKREHDVDIVNHQIEDDVDVEAARAEFAHAVDFKKQRLGDGGFEREDGGIEALEVADLEDFIAAG